MDLKIANLKWSNPNFYKVAIKYLKKGKEPPYTWSQYRKNNFLATFNENVFFNFEQHEDGKALLKYKDKIIAAPFRVDKILLDLYSDPLTSGSRNKLFSTIQQKYIGISRQRVSDFLNNRESYQLFKNPQVYKPALKRVRTKKKNEIWNMDLCIFENIKNYNVGYSYILGLKDAFSKYVWLYPLKRKTEKEIVFNLKKLFVNYRPKALVTDNTLEFKRKEITQLFKDYNIKVIYIKPYAPTENAGIDRFWRSFKESLWKYRTLYNTKSWYNIYKTILEKYNNSSHSSLGGYTPKQVYSTNNNEIIDKVLKTQSKDWNEGKRGKEYEPLEKGMWVRLSLYTDKEVRKKQKFAKGYLPVWSKQIYKVLRVYPQSGTLKTYPNTDKIKIRNKDTKIESTHHRRDLQFIPKTTVFLSQEREFLKRVPGYDREHTARDKAKRPRAPKQVVKVKSTLSERKVEPKRKRATSKKFDDYVLNT